MCDLPGDIVTEVLVRVAAEMAPRLRCVSKSWKTLIDSPEFRHMRYGSITQLVYVCRRNHFYMTRCLDGHEKMIPDMKIEIEGKERERERVDLIGSCNGVLCLLYFDKSKVVVMNPCTKQSVELPHLVDYEDCAWCPIGFGYDNVNDDYKVVRFGGSVGFGYDQLEDDYIKNVNNKLRDFKVYSFRWKRWRDVEPPDHHHKYKWIREPWKNLARGTFANGALHWAIQDSDADEYAILAFDLATERFRILGLPEEVNATLVGEFVNNYHVGDVDGYLSLFLKKSCLGPESDIWMMKEYGVPDSWTRFSWQRQGNIRQYGMLYGLWCNFDVRSVLKPGILDSKAYVGFRTREDDFKCHSENKVDDLILLSPDISDMYRRVIYMYTFTPSLVNLPAQN